jgi:thioredoxin 1
MADEAFKEREQEISEDVVVLQVDYDRQPTLKQRYNIPYQHTFVHVDAQGNALAAWNDGTAETSKHSAKMSNNMPATS